ncbi:MAG: threonine/serine exporter family protein [Proteobacteria bacterium]|nr:threonine/serine exporter family protein [Pseudomonadota bacterium]
MPPSTPALAPFQSRVDFLVALATHLHTCGTTAQRLEGAVLGVARRLKVECEPWSNPTGMILSFRDPAQDSTLTETRVIRMNPGDTDLYRLSETDRIAEEVISGKIGLEEGRAALRALDARRKPPRFWTDALSFGLISLAVAALLRLPWLDIGTAGVAGMLIGAWMHYVGRRSALKESSEAMAGILAATVAILVAAFIAPLNLNTVVIASLVVLLPGMSFTNAINELTSQHLVSGTARFAGALTLILKLTIGVMIALACAEALNIDPHIRYARPQPDWVEGAGLLLAAATFVVVFRADRRDGLVVMSSAIAGYLISRFAGQAGDGVAGTFLAAFAMTAAGNAYARHFNRPGAIVRLPGIILLVPGSASLRGLMTMVQEQSASAGQAALLAVLNILGALIAGLLFGNLVISARRNL